VVEARLAVDLPDRVWVGRVSRAFPGTTFRLLAGVPVADGAVELGELSGPDVEAVAAAVRADPDVRDASSLGSEPGRALARYRTTDTTLYDLAAAAGGPPRYPVVVADGTGTVTVATTRAGLSAAVDWCRESGLAVSVRSLTGEGVPAAAAVLTERQREVVAAALSAGYYDTPRETTLTAVADALDVAPSSVSRTLHRAEGRLVRAAMGGGVDGPAAE
jgi:predicted DNA binding protein